jgi:hypothetical protein
MLSRELRRYGSGFKEDKKEIKTKARKRAIAKIKV